MAAPPPAAYVDAFMQIIRWDNATALFERLQQGGRDYLRRRPITRISPSGIGLKPSSRSMYAIRY